MDALYIRIPGDVVVGVPDSYGYLTTYVLLEQEDWFEKEIRFVRRFLRPDMHCIDIGANYGVYALTMAKAVAPGGSVAAFEPTAATAAMLQASAARNGFSHLRVLPLALSATEGTREFHTYPNSEMNSFAPVSAVIASTVETVAVSTLDRQQAALQSPSIDFVKIDAEGEEANILAGGEAFFRAQSPLVMFEIVAAEGDRLAALAPRFEALGYDLYRLIGPDSLLVPASFSREIDTADYNFFACKPDRAARLAAVGGLVREVPSPPATTRDAGLALYHRQPYGAVFGDPVVQSDRYGLALDAYALWCDPGRTAGERCVALRESFTAAEAASRERPSIARLSTFGRIAREIAKTDLAAQVAVRLIDLLNKGGPPPDEPFFPIDRRYDSHRPANPRQWLLAAGMQAMEEWRSASGYYIPVKSQRLDMLDWLQTTPFASAGIERRRQLQRIRAGLQPQRLRVPLLAQAAPDNLNPELWSGA